MTKKKANRKKKLLKRAGFTMVELIIAVAILGVVTVPIVSSMMRTAQINAKSRALQKATDLAQNLMEGIREYTMEEVIEQCIEPEDFSLIYSSIITYQPTTYGYIDSSSSTFQEGLQNAAINNSYIYGEIKTETETSTESNNANTNGSEPETTTAASTASGSVYVSYTEETYNFAFCDIEYNKSDFDAIVTFEKYIPDGNTADIEYYVYEVTITIYTSNTTERFADNARITSLTGAVQNK